MDRHSGEGGCALRGKRIDFIILSFRTCLPEADKIRNPFIFCGLHLWMPNRVRHDEHGDYGL